MAVEPAELADDIADATWLLILLARLLPFGTSVDRADDTEALMLLAKLLPFGTSLRPVVVELQNGKHEEVMLPSWVESWFEKLDSQLDAAAPVSVVVVPSLTSTTVADDCDMTAGTSEKRMSSGEIFMMAD